MPSLNYWAIFVAALSTFLIGGLWYSPAVFGNAWDIDVPRPHNVSVSPRVRLSGGALPHLPCAGSGR